MERSSLTKMTEKETLRSQILRAARELFVDEGYRNVSMRKIAGRIGCSATTIYLHFRSKGELVNCLAEEMMEKLVNAFQSVQVENLDPIEELRRMGEAYVRLASEDPSGYRIAFMMETDLWNKPEDYLQEGSHALRAYRMILKTVESCVKSRHLVGEEVEAAAQAVFAAIHGLVALWLTYPTFPWASKERLRQMVIDAAVEGILAE